MPLPVIANIHRVALLWAHSAGQHAVNVIHVRGVDTDPDAIMEYLDTNVTAAMWGLQSSGAQITTVEITPLDGTTATQTYTPETPAHWVGGTGGDMIPQASVLVKEVTLSRGRSFRGRIYLPFTPEAVQASGTVTSGDLAATQTAWTTFLATGSDPGPHLVVASYKLAVATGVSAVLVEDKLATQRGRQERVRG